MIYFSVIIPVYNRPEELEDLLVSLDNQNFKNFEVIIVEDGSEITSREKVNLFLDKLEIQYLFKENTGPGLSRNYGAKYAKGDYLVFFDSDCIIPENYFNHVNNFLQENLNTGAFGGPDMAHQNFTPVQKAISYSMTSFLTTGGIRGGKERLDKFHPRSFNMGISSEVFTKTGGFADMRFGEDVDFSLRIIKEGFETRLIPNAGVYHKRRTNFRQFYKQVFNSGIARINLFKKHPDSLKIVHLLPAAFFEGSIILIFLSFFWVWAISPLLLFIFLVFSDSLLKNKDIQVAFLSIIASFVQLWAYGAGFSVAFYKRIIFSKGEFKAFSKNFYK